MSSTPGNKLQEHCVHCPLRREKTFDVTNLLSRECTLEVCPCQYCDKIQHERRTENLVKQIENRAGAAASSTVQTDGLCCVSCGEKFGTLKSLSKHTVVAHGNGCTTCGETFKKLSQFLKHYAVVHNSSVPSLRKPKSNTRSVNGDEKTMGKYFTCHLCGKQFSHSTGLSYHLKHVHEGIKEHECDICGRKFALKAAREDHRRIHTGERPFVCHTCGKTFKAKASLYIHSKTHTDSFPFSCSYCPRMFRWRQQLLSHITTHTGEKKHFCEVCGKGFGVKNDLTRHKLVHSEEKPFLCLLCGMSFGQKRYLKNHEKTKHKKESA